MFFGKRILITGGTGSWGVELTSQLLKEHPQEIIIYSRNESAQVGMQRLFNNAALSFTIGDIRDAGHLDKVCAGVDYIFHLAAIKHVPICEEQPYETLKTNVMGTMNVIEAALKNNVKRVINVSTDKASDPSNFYGLSKAMGEKLIASANIQTNETRFINIRGGNVLGTSGSVVEEFKRQIQERKQVSITHKEMTRFFMTQEEAVCLLLRASKEGIGGETFVMNMPACTIYNLAEVLIESTGMTDITWVEVGIRPGEKIHEVLYSDFESSQTYVYDSQYFVILPQINIVGLKQKYAGYQQVPLGKYSSQDDLMNKGELSELLKRGRFI